MGTIMTVVGNRPQFIKMAPVSAEIAKRGHREIIVHTGQHYDEKLSDIFFRELSINTPDIQLTVEGRTHGAMTGDLLIKIEEIFLRDKPKSLLVYGDTNSTLAAALAAAKLHIPIAHVEAGPRMRDLTMPEEVNRITVDHLSKLLFAPDKPSVEHLKREGITEGVYLTGDVMLDTFRLTEKRAAEQSAFLKDARLARGFVFMTLHRPANVDSQANLEKLLAFFRATPETLYVFPAHLRTVARMKDFGLYEAFSNLDNLMLTEPLGYIDTVAALTACSHVITDSGGLQKEAFYAGKKALVLLDEILWPELEQAGWQSVPGGLGTTDLIHAFTQLKASPTPATSPDFYGKGDAARIMVDALEQHGFFTD